MWESPNIGSYNRVAEKVAESRLELREELRQMACRLRKGGHDMGVVHPLYCLDFRKNQGSREAGYKADKEFLRRTLAVVRAKEWIGKLRAIAPPESVIGQRIRDWPEFSALCGLSETRPLSGSEQNRLDQLSGRFNAVRLQSPIRVD